MGKPLEQIQEEIRGLSASDKEQLLRALWEDLDGPADSNVDAAWLDEARRRDAEFDSDPDASVPAKDVFETLRATLKK